MCEMCEKIGSGNPDREYRPLRLACKSTTLADALVAILIEMNAGLKDRQGGVMNPYADGLTVVMPWAGHPKFANAITVLVTTTQVAEPEAIRAMTYGAMAQGMSTSEENVREFGEGIARLMADFMSTVGSEKPIDVDGLMSTLDRDLSTLEQDEKRRED